MVLTPSIGGQQSRRANLEPDLVPALKRRWRLAWSAAAGVALLSPLVVFIERGAADHLGLFSLSWALMAGLLGGLQIHQLLRGGADALRLHLLTATASLVLGFQLLRGALLYWSTVQQELGDCSPLLISALTLFLLGVYHQLRYRSENRRNSPRERLFLVGARLTAAPICLIGLLPWALLFLFAIPTLVVVLPFQFVLLDRLRGERPRKSSGLAALLIAGLVTFGLPWVVLFGLGGRAFAVVLPLQFLVFFLLLRLETNPGKGWALGALLLGGLVTLGWGYGVVSAASELLSTRADVGGFYVLSSLIGYCGLGVSLCALGVISRRAVTPEPR